MSTTKKVAASLAAVVGIGAAAFGISAVTPATAQAPAPPQPPMRGNHRGEHHGEIRRALMNLQRAQGALQQAKHDLGGHREQALDLVQRAIDQCQQALSDDKH